MTIQQEKFKKLSDFRKTEINEFFNVFANDIKKRKNENDKIYDELVSGHFSLKQLNENSYNLQECIVCMITSQENSNIICACRDNSIKIICQNNIFNYPMPEMTQEQKNKNLNFIYSHLCD